MAINPKKPLIMCKRKSGLPKWIDPYKLLPGTKDGKCLVCGETILISPSSIEEIKNGDLNPVCYECIVRAMPPGKTVFATTTEEGDKDLHTMNKNEAEMN